MSVGAGRFGGPRFFLLAVVAAAGLFVLCVGVPLGLAQRPQLSLASGLSHDLMLAAERACLIFCADSPVLAAVQSEGVFPSDSKIFVDLPMRADPEEILKQFKLRQPTGSALHAFVSEYFEPLHNSSAPDLIPIVPVDFCERPARLQELEQPARDWALGINNIWKGLVRRTNVSMPERHSLLSARHPIVVPGGRFRESYYWDSFWIIGGLLVSGMHSTARGVISNFLDSIEVFGVIPNGGRAYYLTRSQPPLLSEMVRLYFEHTRDIALVERSIPLLEAEYASWMSGRSAVKVKGHILNRYFSNVTTPRPESWREDEATAKAAVGEVLPNVHAAAESGWDFSSRWLDNGINLTTAITADVVPVDLNTFLYRMARNIANFHSVTGNLSAAAVFSDRAEKRKCAIESVLWNGTMNQWFDFRISRHQQRPEAAVSNFVPLWGNLAEPGRLRRVTDALLSSNLLQQAGLQATVSVTGQQWDSPNGWAPLQQMVVEGLMTTNDPHAQQVGRRIAHRWLQTNFEAWQKTGAMYEKYDTGHMGSGGGGGEYTPQTGFGWTNGVVLMLLDKFGGIPSVADSSFATA
mmetsp:Transcript_10664/g.23516  ORF Transcript_10664/g.23516 Transcript_10664/m.23516 type:complete len:578 (+) Transcript_10664:38-1771(+)|eukprot:CAMPEP_0204343018 /NCGR_PEP_ID=MMETSP0469-20131031/24586_1 /ASSEMBLY_ACC=CAM_ASM_000384 /TAXON_ID=2969 /ORGANISM="Oxyrrhis marina" /LENGTH=577 /DNA_ID=CAMNT_0051328045 /DNA_START=15 /DNA_END=1748 /DNA_ORIENTATION=-